MPEIYGAGLEFELNGEVAMVPSEACPVSSVNGKIGVVKLKTSDIPNDSGYINEEQAQNAAPVQTVNGQTGDVDLTAEDVGALPDDTEIPAKISDLENDIGIEEVKTYADLLTSTTDIVHVLDISGSPFGLRGDCWFYKSTVARKENPTQDELKTYSAGYAYRETTDKAVMLAMPDQVPTPAANAPVVSLGDCIASYVLPHESATDSTHTIDYGDKTMFDTDGNYFTAWNAAETLYRGQYRIHGGIVYRAGTTLQGVEPTVDNSQYGTVDDVDVERGIVYQRLQSFNLVDCASFVWAALGGILFDKSRYILGRTAKNVYGVYAGDNYLSDDTYKIDYWHHAYHAARTAEYFAQQKRLFRLKETKGTSSDPDDLEAVRQLRFGDLLFVSNYTDNNTVYRAYRIDHVMLVLAVFPDGQVLVAQGGGDAEAGLVATAQRREDFNGGVPTCKISLFNLSGRIGEGKAYQVFARPNYGGMLEKPEIIPVTVNRYEGTRGADNLRLFARITPDRNLIPGEAYTLILRGNLPYYGDNHKLAVFTAKNDVANQRVIYLSSAYVLDADRIAIPFVIAPTIDLVSSLRVCDYKATSASEHDCYIAEAALVRGFADIKELTSTIAITSATDYTDVVSQLDAQVRMTMPNYSTRRGRMTVTVSGAATICEWKIEKRDNTRYSIGVMGSGGTPWVSGMGARSECVNGTVTVTTYTAENPIPFEYVY